jgi:hypothetical protein
VPVRRGGHPGAAPGARGLTAQAAVGAAAAARERRSLTACARPAGSL